MRHRCLKYRGKRPFGRFKKVRGDLVKEVGNDGKPPWWNKPLADSFPAIRDHEEQVFLVLTLVIGALTGLTVVAFIVVTEHLGMRLYPVGSAAWRRSLIPVLGSVGMGYLLYRYFPDARGSGVPQTKAALFARGGRITLGTTLGKFFCTAATLASGIPLGREGPSVQVGGGIASVIGRYLGLSPNGSRHSYRSALPPRSRRVQHATGRSGLLAGRDHRGSSCAHLGFRGAGIGNVLGRSAAASREPSSVPGSSIPTRTSVGIRDLCRLGVAGGLVSVASPSCC